LLLVRAKFGVLILSKIPSQVAGFKHSTIYRARLHPLREQEAYGPAPYGVTPEDKHPETTNDAETGYTRRKGHENRAATK
jgi:hypothetical protein